MAACSGHSRQFRRTREILDYAAASTQHNAERELRLGVAMVSRALQPYPRLFFVHGFALTLEVRWYSATGSLLWARLA